MEIMIPVKNSESVVDLKSLDIVEIAKLIRKDLKAGARSDPRLHGIERFSVTTQRYAGGQSLTVAIVRADRSPYNPEYFAAAEAIENTSFSDFTGSHVPSHIGQTVRDEIKASFSSMPKYSGWYDEVQNAVEEIISKYQEVQGKPGERWYSFFDYICFCDSFSWEAKDQAKLDAVELCCLTLRKLEEAENDEAELAEANQLDEEEMASMQITGDNIDSFQVFTPVKKSLKPDPKEEVFEGWSRQDELDYQSELDRVEKQNEEIESGPKEVKSTINLDSADNLVEFPRVNSLSGEVMEKNLDDAILSAEEEVRQAELTLSNLKKACQLKALRAQASSIAESIENYRKILSL